MESSIDILIFVFILFIIVMIIYLVFQYQNKEKLDSYYAELNKLSVKNIILLQDSLKKVEDNLEFFKNRNAYLSQEYERIFKENISLRLKIENLKSIIEE